MPSLLAQRLGQARVLGVERAARGGRHLVSLDSAQQWLGASSGVSTLESLDWKAVAVSLIVTQ